MKSDRLARLDVLLFALFLGVGLGSGMIWGQALEGEILFYSESTNPGQLYILDLSTSAVRPVGRSGARPDHYPSWSADGRWIAFEGYRGGGWHPWLMAADGSGARRMTDSPANRTDHYEFDPTLASDGQTLVFIKDFDLYSATLDDSTPRRIGPATPTLLETAPAFSPDMRRIAFSGYDENSKSQHLYVVSADGSERRELTMGPGIVLAPTWSPDGKKLLFYSDLGGSLELYEIDGDGGTPTSVLTAEVAAAAGFEPAPLVDPWDNDNGATEQYRADYSPDGAWIAFSRDFDGDRELFVVDRSGKQIRRLTHRPGHDGFPAWRP